MLQMGCGVKSIPSCQQRIVEPTEFFQFPKLQYNARKGAEVVALEVKHFDVLTKAQGGRKVSKLVLTKREYFKFLQSPNGGR